MRLLTLALAILGTGAMANEPPPVPEGGLQVVFILQTCQDAETLEKGTCYVLQDKDGNIYSTFYQDGVLMFIRKSIPDGYETIWTNDQFNTI